MTAPAVPEGFRPIAIADGFIAINGPLYLRHEGEVVQLGFRVEDRHCNLMGMCHGGMMASLCDMLVPVTAHRRQAVGLRFLPTVSLQVDYLGVARRGAWVQGEAELLRVTRNMVFAQGLVHADGEPVARLSGIFKLGPPFDPGGLRVD